MKKKGFTIVEIIVVIALIAFIGTISFFGIRLVSNNIKENKLERIEDKILLAAETYIETHKEVKTKVNDQGVIIPLNVLHNEGLINLDGIIDKNDDDYVMALLANPTPGEECESTYIEGSWKIGSKILYICTKNSGSGGSNLAIINPDAMSNSNKASREPYYFTGGAPYNYVSHAGKTFRILSVDPDDSLVIVGDELDDVFTANQMQTTLSGKGSSGSFSCDINTGKVKYTGSESEEKVNGVAFISAKDLIKAKECYVNSFNIDSSDVKNCSIYQSQGCQIVGSATSGGTSITYLSWLDFKGSYVARSGGEKKYAYYAYRTIPYTGYGTDYAAFIEGSSYTIETINNNNKSCYNDYADAQSDRNSIPCDNIYKTFLYQKVHLKPCMKIKSGVGSFENPYELNSTC